MTSTRRLVLAGLAVSLLLAGVLSLWASGDPDGLAHVAQQLGFASTAAPHPTDGSPLSGYSVRGVDGPASRGVAGVVGVLLVGGLAFGLTWLLRRRGSSQR